ncbi:hypothetical protein JW926_00730, partial [Candidatus Sumerlaeota bacterium]|nr:hypothetical protein [Candidatus Sumerlaeota bacterium]
YEVIGVDKDAFSRELDACGADCFPRNDPEGFHLASDFREQQSIIDLYKSCYPEKAIIDTEYHIMHYWIPVSAQHIKAMMWDGAVHGRSAAAIWVWGRNLENPEHSIMNQPWCFEALAHSALDLRRFSREIFALANVKPEVALIYNGRGYLESYEELYFTGIPFILLPDGRITKENLERFKAIVAPKGAAVSDAAAMALEAYAKRGGRILGKKDSLLHNLYGDETPTRGVLGKVEFYDTAETKNSGRILREILDKEDFATRPFRIVSRDNQRLFVTWRAAKFDDAWLIFVINYNREAREVIIKPVEGISIKDGVDLITGERVDLSLRLPSLEPALIRYRLDAR